MAGEWHGMAWHGMAWHGSLLYEMRIFICLSVVVLESYNSIMTSEGSWTLDCYILKAVSLQSKVGGT